jgi:hypothetical protein
MGEIRVRYSTTRTDVCAIWNASSPTQSSTRTFLKRHSISGRMPEMSPSCSRRASMPYRSRTIISLILASRHSRTCCGSLMMPGSNMRAPVEIWLKLCGRRATTLLQIHCMFFPSQTMSLTGKLARANLVFILCRSTSGIRPHRTALYCDSRFEECERSALGNLPDALPTQRGALEGVDFRFDSGRRP